MDAPFSPMPEIAGVVFFVWFFAIYAFMMLTVAAAYVVVLIALWRLMRAHESLARSVAEIGWTLRYGRLADSEGEDAGGGSAPGSPAQEG